MRSTVLVLVLVLALGGAIGMRSDARAGLTELPDTCNGLKVTIAQIGGVVYGTGGKDVIVALDASAVYGYGGNDTICVANSFPNVNLVDAGSGDDYVHGCDDTIITLSICSYEVRGGSGNDTLLLFGYVFGASGNDNLLGFYEVSSGSGKDAPNGLVDYNTACDGGSGTDTATNCGSTVNVP